MARFSDIADLDAAPINAIKLRRTGRRPLGFRGALVLSLSSAAKAAAPSNGGVEDQSVDRPSAADDAKEMTVRHRFRLFLTETGGAVAAIDADATAGERSNAVALAEQIDGVDDLRTLLDAYAAAPERVAPPPNAPSPADAEAWADYAQLVSTVRTDFAALRARLPLTAADTAASA